MSATIAQDPAPVPCFVLAAGKAAWPMYQAVASTIPIERGVIATALGRARGVPQSVEWFEAGHPLPNEASEAAGRQALALGEESAARGGLLVLLSGGASAMLAVPAPGLTLDDKIQTARALMAAGAAIHELNCVRKHLSRIKGGRLAAAARRTLTLALSDVHGPVPDDPSVIASGPTVADETTFSDALEVIRARGVTIPAQARAYLQRGARGDVEETIKRGDLRVAASTYRVIGTRHTAMEGARRSAERLGFEVVVLPDATSGEARLAAEAFVGEVQRRAASVSRPLCVIASGETTVTVRGGGVGGRNQELALAAAPLLPALAKLVVLGSAGTDGIDGPTNAAGAVVDSTTLQRALQLGLDWRAALSRNDSHTFFDALGDRIVWGPTGTNVGDLHVALVASSTPPG